MKALVKARPEPGLWMLDVDEPAVGPRDVKIRVRKTSICGTDLHIHHWDAWAQQTIPVPMVIGHEFMGDIVEVGPAVAGLEPGMRVAGEGHVTCGHCRNCKAGRREFCHQHTGVGVTRPGAFAEYVVIPAENVFVVPAHIDDDVAAILDPLGNATHTALRFDCVGEDVLVTGAGPIGVLSAAIARHVGARHLVVTDVNPYRLAMAARHGADRVVDVRTESLAPVMAELGMTEGFDVGLEMSGAEAAFNQMLDAMNHGGRIAILGIPAGPMTLDVNDVIFKGLELQGIYGRRIFETWYKMAAMLQSGLDVAGVITHRVRADAFDEAFAIVETGECGKVILDWV
ncbi:MAG: L-threonine 3-dehydrogenase [Acidimicrobiales bacterium]|nr:L-threonine 3-dehydrogenase [Acidimicrobiales bacterium]MCB9393610.1 L-threonine 3-dehydrogenase [Acidimicrobiaceae bacterium]